VFRNLLLPSLLCLALPVVCFAQQKNRVPSKATQSKAYNEIERLEIEWNTVNEVSDAEGKERLLADDSYHIGSDGRFYDKIQDVAIQREARKRKKATNNVVKFDIADRQIRLFKDVAIVTGLGTTFVTTNGQKRLSGQFRFVHIWEKRGARWRLTVDQTTAVRNPPPVRQAPLPLKKPAS
jgi:ketosteroid isomerase-like protein